MKNINIKSIASNTSIVLFTNIFKSLFFLISFIIVFRNSSPDEIGSYGLGWTLASLGYILSYSGSAQVLIDLKRITKEIRAAAFIQSQFIIFLFIIIILLLSLVLPDFYKGLENLELSLYLAAIFTFLMGLGGCDMAIMQRNLMFKELAVMQFFSSLLSSVIAITFAYSGFPLVGLFCIQGLSSFFIFSFSRIYFRFSLISRFRLTDAKKTWKIGKHITLASITQVISQNGFYFILAILISSKDFGFFVTCHRIISTCISLLNRTLDTLLLPYFSKINDLKTIAIGYLQSQKYLLGISFFIFCIFITCYESILDIFIKGYPAGDSIVFLFLSISFLFHQYGCGIATTLRAIGKPDFAWKWNLIQILLSLISLYFLSVFELSMNEYAFVIALFSLSTILISYPYILTKLEIKLYSGLRKNSSQTIALILCLMVSYLFKFLLVNLIASKYLFLFLMILIISFAYIIIINLLDSDYKKLVSNILAK